MLVSIVSINIGHAHPRVIPFIGISESKLTSEAGTPPLVGLGTAQLTCSVTVAHVKPNVEQNISVDMKFYSVPFFGPVTLNANYLTSEPALGQMSSEYKIENGMAQVIETRGGPNSGTKYVRYTMPLQFQYANLLGNSSRGIRMKHICSGSITVNETGNQTRSEVIAVGAVEYIANHPNDPIGRPGTFCPSAIPRSRVPYYYVPTPSGLATDNICFSSSSSSIDCDPITTHAGVLYGLGANPADPSNDATFRTTQAGIPEVTCDYHAVLFPGYQIGVITVDPATAFANIRSIPHKVETLPFQINGGRPF